MKPSITSHTSSTDPDESQSSVAQLTLEEVMNQAMKQMAQTMAATETASSSSSPISTAPTQHQETLLKKISKTLPEGWEVGVTVHGRIYYIE
jgi:hypothetical protein